MKTFLARLAGTSRAARVLLHLVCAARDHKWAWHLAGIRRELP